MGTEKHVIDPISPEMTVHVHVHTCACACMHVCDPSHGIDSRSIFPPESQFRLLMKCQTDSKTFGPTYLRHCTLHVHPWRTLTCGGDISRAPPTRRTVHRTCMHACPSHAPRHTAHAVLLSRAGATHEPRAKSLSLSGSLSSESAGWRGGQAEVGRRDEDPVRGARRKQSGQRGRAAGLLGVSDVLVCYG